MRCLQCGKALPLLKRLAGGEFCSDAHRKEYQQEYTNLALSRLRQAVAPTVQPLRVGELPKATTPDVPPSAPVAASAPRVPHQSVSNVGAAPPTTPARIASVPPVPAPTTSIPLLSFPVISESAAATQPRRTPPVVPRPQSKAAPPKRDAKPAMAGTLTRKPPAAKIRWRRISAPLEVVPAGTRPALPHRPDTQASTGLATANLIYWAPVCERRESATAVMESRLDVRGFVRISPVMDVGMNVIPPRGWDLTRQVPQQSVPMRIPDAISPGEPVLWNAAPRPFSGSIPLLGQWAAMPFSTIERAGEISAETQTKSPERPAATTPGQMPAPLVVDGIAAGKARPTMVLGTAVNSASSGQSSVNDKPRKPEVRILAPEKPAIAQAEPQPAVPLAQPVPALDLGLQAPRASSGRSSSKILTLFGGSQE